MELLQSCVGFNGVHTKLTNKFTNKFSKIGTKIHKCYVELSTKKKNYILSLFKILLTQISRLGYASMEIYLIVMICFLFLPGVDTK